MTWATTRRLLEAATQAPFLEPGLYTPQGGVPQAVTGVLTQTVETESDESLGYERTAHEYEIRKDSGPWTAASFPFPAELKLDTGARFAVIYVAQTDTLLYLGLAPIEDT